MSTRLQVVMGEEEHDEIRAAAQRCRMTVSEWVRLVLREERARGLHGPRSRVREPPTFYGGAPPGPTRRVPLELDIREDLLDAVRDRYRLPNRRAAIEFALRRAAVEPMSKEEALAMEGAGWEGDLDTLRAGDPAAAW